MATDIIARALAAGSSPPYVSASYFIPDGFSKFAAGVAVAAGQLRMYPGIIRKPVTISDLLVRISTLAASGNFQLSVYAADPMTNMPTGAPRYTSASQTTAAAALITISNVGLTLQPGLYWFAVQVDTSGAAAVFIGPDSSVANFHQLAGSPNTTGILNAASLVTGVSKTGSYGTWPTLTGNFTTDTLSVNNDTRSAAVVFKVA